MLIDASSEPEISVYDRLHAGAWDDGTVTPAPNRRIDIHATVRELERAPSVGDRPLVVVTAGILEDQWLRRTVPRVEARGQTRLAGLSSKSVHVLDRGVGHFIPEHDPRIVLAALDAVIVAVRSGHPLAPCHEIFHGVQSAVCLARGALGHQQTRTRQVSCPPSLWARIARRYATATASKRRCSSSARSNGTRSGRCDSTIRLS